MTPNKILSLLKVQWISTYLAGKDISRILQDSLGYVDDVFHIKLLFVSIAKFLTCCLISAKPFISTDFSGTKAYDHQLYHSILAKTCNLSLSLMKMWLVQQDVYCPKVVLSNGAHYSLSPLTY